jgi:hypothetical protein
MENQLYTVTKEQLEAMMDRVCNDDWDRARFDDWIKLWETPQQVVSFDRNELYNWVDENVEQIFDVVRIKAGALDELFGKEEK